MNWLVQPFHYAFMQNASLAVVIVGVSCSVLGCFVVLRRMAFIGDAIAHTALPGVVIAYLRGWNLFMGALIAGVLTALGIGWLSRRDALREDTAIGILFTGMFAMGVLIISRTHSFRDFSSMLFGDVLSITRLDLLLISAILLIVIGAVGLCFKELELVSVDPNYATVIGLRVERMRNLLLLLLALSVVAGIQAVGVILTSALLITPAATASLMTRSLLRMMIVAAAVSIVAGIAGLYASYYLGVASGASIVLSGTAIFTIVFTFRSLARNASQRKRRTD